MPRACTGRTLDADSDIGVAHSALKSGAFRGTCPSLDPLAQRFDVWPKVSLLERAFENAGFEQIAE
jgi:hypothetical protein